MKQIKFRLLFAFLMGSFYSAVYDSVGKMSQPSFFDIWDAIYVSFIMCGFLLSAILATNEQIKNK